MLYSPVADAAPAPAPAPFTPGLVAAALVGKAIVVAGVKKGEGILPYTSRKKALHTTDFFSLPNKKKI